jgi:hypothetical protein
MNEFWCDLLDISDVRTFRLEDVLPLTNEGRTFCENRFLASINTLNVLLVDAVFFHVTRGLHVPRYIVTRFQDRRTNEENEDNNAPPLSLDAVLIIIFQHTRFASALTSAHVPQIKKTYQDAYFHYKSNRIHVKKAFLKRLVSRVARASFKDADDLDAFVETQSTYPIHHVYANALKRGAYPSPRAFYRAQRIHVSELLFCSTDRAKRNAFEVKRPYEAFVSFLGKERTPDEFEGVGETAAAEGNSFLVSLDEFVCHTLINDGYFLKKFYNVDKFQTPATSSWMTIQSDDDYKSVSWITKLFLNDVIHSKRSTLVTRENTRKPRTAAEETMDHCASRIITGRRFFVSIHGISYKAPNPSKNTIELAHPTITASIRDKPPQFLQSRVWTDLCAESIRMHIDFFVGANESLPPPEYALKQLMFHDFVMQYVFQNDLPLLSHDASTPALPKKTRLQGPPTMAANGRDSDITSKEDTNTNAIILIDNRNTCALGMASILMALKNVTHHSVDMTSQINHRWVVYVFCAEQNEMSIRNYLRPHFRQPERDLHIRVLKDLSVKNKFEIEDYNTLLKSSSFWRNLEGCDKCMLVQNDGMLVRPGVENIVSEYDYVGAPWRQGQTLLQHATNPELVGNGGLSIRSVRAMIEICEAGEKNGGIYDLFINGAQPTPEDVFFSRGIHELRDKYKIAPRAVAMQFASEQDITETSLGFHKPWPYNDIPTMAKFYERVLAENSVSAK